MIASRPLVHWCAGMSILLLSTAQAQTLEHQHSQSFFRYGADAPPLATPQRSNVRASLQQRYPNLAEAVGIDAATAEKLLDLLTEHRMSAMDASRLNPQRASFDWALTEADAEALRLDALRRLLGEQGLERYQDYSTSPRERTPVKPPDARLPGEYRFPLKLAIELTINRNQPVVVSHVVTNGQSVTFPVSDGLLAEATPLYNGDSFDIHLAYFEQRGTRKRRLNDIANVSTLPVEGAPIDIEQFTVAAGSKAYAIKASVSVGPVESMR